MNDTWFVIINPVSGKNKGRKLWSKIKPLLTDGDIPFAFVETAYINHAALLAEDAAKTGNRNFLIIGGDGTANDVINGLKNSTINLSEFTVAMLSAGTGNDWVRTIGKCKLHANIINALKQKQGFIYDVGECLYYKNGEQLKRYFINIVGLGFEGHVAKRLFEENSIFTGSKLQYQIAILRSLFIYKHTNVTVTVDDKSHTFKTLSIAAGIGKYNGGGLKQLPDSEFNDGLLDMTLIGNMSKLKMVLSLPKLQSGIHIKMQEVETYRAQLIKIESDPPIYVDADGEYLGTTPVELRILPEKINILKWE